MVEFIFEVLIQTLFESLPKWIGILVKWTFYLGRKSISRIKEENWNKRIGIIVLLLVFGIVTYLIN